MGLSELWTYNKSYCAFNSLIGRDSMKTYYIQHGLIGSFGGEANEWEVYEANSWQEAENYAYELACEDYESYEGMYGLRTVNDIMEEEGLTEDEAYDSYLEERESWLHYVVLENDPTGEVA